MKHLALLAVLPFVTLRAAERDDNRTRESKAAYHVVEAILAAPDMTFKMPVLEAAFLDTPEWEQRLQHVINREPWAFAKVHFIHFYWKRVSKKNTPFLDRAFAFVRDYRRTDDTLAIVTEMLDSR
ncbi:MAG: hypothetical protein JNK23_13370 [Opitutaceae bacterium]|nr:hypothetical protein [Opitutaceae bacterium]